MHQQPTAQMNMGKQEQFQWTEKQAGTLQVPDMDHKISLVSKGLYAVVK